jgi:hypothetical protein
MLWWTPMDTAASPPVDSWRFLPPRLARLLQARIESAAPVTEIPFTPLAAPLRDARIALLSTAGLSCPPDPPFDMDGERADPTWGDPCISRPSAPRDAASRPARRPGGARGRAHAGRGRAPPVPVAGGAEGDEVGARPALADRGDDAPARMTRRRRRRHRA